MVISVPIPATVQKEQTEKTIEIRVPSIKEEIKKNKILGAFYTVLSAPVK
jgi:hypothetical protein